MRNDGFCMFGISVGMVQTVVVIIGDKTVWTVVDLFLSPEIIRMPCTLLPWQGIC